MKKSNLNLSYHEQDGVLLPNICISDQPEDEQPLGRYGRMALAYLRENHPERYAVLKMDGNLMKTMHRVQRDALERMEHLTQQMLLDVPVPETEDLLERARHWNDLRQHRTIWQAHSAKDFASYERDKRAGILYVFPPFITARMGRKIGRRPQTQLCGDALKSMAEKIVLQTTVFRVR